MCSMIIYASFYVVMFPVEHKTVLIIYRGLELLNVFLQYDKQEHRLLEHIRGKEIIISKYLKNGHNSVRKGLIKNSSQYTQLRTRDDNPRRFQDHPLKL